MEQIRHGDILLTKVSDKAPALKKRRRITLAEGETTGHAHRVEGAAKLTKTERETLLSVREATLDHEEHGLVVLRQGTYLVTRQQETIQPWSAAPVSVNVRD